MPPKNTAKKKKQEQLAEEVKKIRRDQTKNNLICADCPVRSTPYICINYSSFICTECSGIHRKFNHRVKSIAVATFTEKEVNNIREGGNALLNRKYLARYKKGKDTFTLPREGEKDKIEKYIQLKYIDKKWYKENPKPKKKKKKKKKKRKKSLSVSDEEHEEAQEEVEITKSPSQSISFQSPTKPQAQPVQQPPQVADILSFGAPTQVQPVQQQQQVNNGDDWGNFNDGNNAQNNNNNNTQSNDNQGWDPFAADNTPVQPVQQPIQQQQQQQKPTQNDTMGWDNSLWDDAPAPQQAQVQPQPPPANNNTQFGGFQNGGFNNQAPPQHNNFNGYNNQQQPQQPQQPPAQIQTQQNNADDLWGAIAGINIQQQEAEAEAKKKADAEAAAKLKAEEEKKKNKQPWNDPFADMMSGTGIEPSNSTPVQVVPQQQRNSLLGNLGSGLGVMGMNQQQQQGNMQQKRSSGHYGGGGNPYMNQQQQVQGNMRQNNMQNAQGMMGGGNPYMNQGNMQNNMQNVNRSSGYGNVGMGMGGGGNPYMNPQGNNQMGYMNAQQGNMGGNPYMNPQGNRGGVGGQYQSGGGNPYMNKAQGNMGGNMSPYMNKAVQQNNPYMNKQGNMGGMGGGGGNPFK